MKYYIVSAGCGDPGLITVKGMENVPKSSFPGSLVNPELVAASPASVKLDSGDARRNHQSYRRRCSGRSFRRPSSFWRSTAQSLNRSLLLKKKGSMLRSSQVSLRCLARRQHCRPNTPSAGFRNRLNPAGETLESDQITELSAHGTTISFFQQGRHRDEKTAAPTRKTGRCGLSCFMARPDLS